MATTVRLTVESGPHKGRRFCIRGPAKCLVGRAADCFMRFVGADRDLSISRHHCQLLVDPPVVSVQDLGSLNGTYVNGRAVATTSADQGEPNGNVRSGDVITIGGTSLAVDILDCPDSADVDQDPVWKEGEVAKEDCPIPCLADGSMPFLGCCVGGFSEARVS